MSSEVGVKLVGDNTEFVAMLKGSVEKAGQFSGELVGKVGGKLTGLKDVSQAVSTALGINITNIAEGVARLVTGMSKEVEEALKGIVEATQKAADINIATMRAAKTEQQRYQDDLKQVQRLLREQAALHEAIKKAEAGEIDGMLGLVHSAEELKKNAERQLQITEIDVKLAERGADIKAYELKLKQDATKLADETLQKTLEATEKQIQSRMDLLGPEQKIQAIRDHISELENAIANVLGDQVSLAAARAALQENENKLVAEQVKLVVGVGEANDKNAKADAEAMDKRIDRARAELPLQTQREELIQNIATLEGNIDSGLAMEWDMTSEIKQLDEKRVQLKEVENKQIAANLEIAKLLLKPAGELTKSDQLRLDLLTDQTTQVKVNKEIAEILAKGAANLTDQDKARLSVLTGQSEELQNQINKAKEMLSLTISIKRVGTTYENQSTAALEGVRDRVKSQLDRAHQENAQVPTGGYKNPMEIALASEYQQITNELNARRNISNYANQFGDEAARAKYGDTLVDRTQRETRDFTSRTATAVEKLQQQLQTFFKLPS